MRQADGRGLVEGVATTEKRAGAGGRLRQLAGRSGEQVATEVREAAGSPTAAEEAAVEPVRPASETTTL
jgi:hypothetical protein